MAWTNLVAGVVVGALAVYLFTQARTLAEDERVLFQTGSRFVKWRVLSHQLGAAFLAIMVIAILIGGVR